MVADSDHDVLCVVQIFKDVLPQMTNTSLTSPESDAIQQDSMDALAGKLESRDAIEIRDLMKQSEAIHGQLMANLFLPKYGHVWTCTPCLLATRD